MTPTPEMVEAAARAICTRQGFKPDIICALTGMAQWKTFARDAEEAIKAALAAMWRPIEEAPKNGTLIAVLLPETTSHSDLTFYCPNPKSRVSYAWNWNAGKFRPYICGDVVTTFVLPTHFIPLSLFEDRK